MNRRNFVSSILAGAPAALASARKAPITSASALGLTGRAAIPNVKVASQEGKSYRFYDDLVKGKMVVINFFYANCSGVCPRMTSNLLKVQQQLRERVGERVGRDIFLYSISLKPEEDTPKRLAAYARMHGIARDSGWLLLRARKDDAELLRRRLGFVDSDPVLDADVNQHTGMVRLGSDVYDKWSASPALGPAYAIVNSLLWLDLKLPR